MTVKWDKKMKMPQNLTLFENMTKTLIEVEGEDEMKPGMEIRVNPSYMQGNITKLDFFWNFTSFSEQKKMVI